MLALTAACFYAETADLDYPALLARWHDTLTGPETERLTSLRLDRDRRDYLAAHVLERVAAPAGWRRSSLTHTDGLVACAFVSEDMPIGVDAEPATAEARLARMAGTVRSPGDSASLGLTQLWTVKEAYLKSIGAGFSDSAGFLVLRALECTYEGLLDEWATIAVRDVRTDARAGAWVRTVGEHVLAVSSTGSAPPRLTRVDLR